LVFLFFYYIYSKNIIFMPNINDIHSIIVSANTPNLSAHTYTEIYGGTAGCTAVINGVSVNVGPASNIKVIIKSITGGSGCYLLGENRDVYNGSDGLGGIN
jgi:hypothetical protein